MSWWQGYRPTRPYSDIEAQGPAEAPHGAVKHWWSSRWVEALSGLLGHEAWRRSQSQARPGNVLRLELGRRGIDSEVLADGPEPYRQHIEITPLRDQTWAAVTTILAEDEAMLAPLRAGEMPGTIETVFQSADARLFPEHEEDLDMRCDCPDEALLCSHLAAVLLRIGDDVDEEPFLLLRLRGRAREALLEDIAVYRQSRAKPGTGSAQADAAPELEDMLDDFWRAGRGLANIQVHPGRPTVENPILRRLGRPSFSKLDLVEALGPATQRISALALELAFSGGTTPARVDDSDAGDSGADDSGADDSAANES